MTHSFDILFDPLAERRLRGKRLDRVITPVDAFTGRIVARGVTAKIPHEARRARRSLSGHLVFENLLVPAPVRIEIDTSEAGYFSPAPLEFDDPQAHDADDETDIRLLPLEMLPARVIDGEAAVVRGGVRRGGDWVDGARIIGIVDGVDQPFETRTDARGSFALRVRMADVDQSAGLVSVPPAFDVALTVSHDGDDADRDVTVRDLQTTTIDIIDLPDP